MSVTINLRTLLGFMAGFVVAVIVFFLFHALTADAVQSDEATFVPITPCRLFDTRPSSNVGPRSIPIGENSAVAFQVTGANGECTIPAAATAVSVNLTAVSPSAATNLRLYPANAAVPTASVLNMVPGQGPTPNKLDVKLSPDGKLAIYNRFGSIDVVGDVMGYYRHDGVAGLEARIAELEALTASMSKATVDGQPTVRFTGVNVQVVSGSGSTDGALNGKGNLIVGYDENVSDTRTGSHNLVIGDQHSYTSYGGLLAGFNNETSGAWASASGGYRNTADGPYSAITGGSLNMAGGDHASVSGGSFNEASGTGASVSGGPFNTASGEGSSVSGGGNNTAGGPNAAVSGGDHNTAIGTASSVSGGTYNSATSDDASVSGGYGNAADAPSSSVSGGNSRSALGGSDWVAGALLQDF